MDIENHDKIEIFWKTRYEGCVSKKSWKSVYDELGGNPQVKKIEYSMMVMMMTMTIAMMILLDEKLLDKNWIKTGKL